jgi:iron complex transport system ATP-binding protein
MVPRAPDPLLAIRGVTLLRGDVPALRRFSWTVQSGEHWAVLGPNGSGKSSLVQMLQGWLWPQAGNLTVLGRRFGSDDVAELRRRVAWVGSEAEPEFPGRQTVADIVLSGAVGTHGLQFERPSARQRAAAKRALAELGLTALSRRPFQRLSQGQRRLAVIARAVAMRPDLLLLDEASAGLDPVARAGFLCRVGRLIRRGAEGPAVVYSTHHLEEVLPGFTHVLLLRRGRVVGAGPRKSMLTPRRLRAAFGARFEIPR